MHYLLSATIFLQTEPVGVPVWVPVLIAIILLLLFLWGLTRNNIPQGEPAHADDHHNDHHDAHHNDAHLPVVETAVPAHPVAATKTENVAVVPDDLKKIEGIGPKIERILHDAGITTFAALAATSVAQLEQIVREEAGIRIAFPDTWPQQASLAAAGDWDALETLQDELKGGRLA
ncbi:MAG: helix-hairpin-helix domain-containing protein [Chloroflexota bacterium]